MTTRLVMTVLVAGLVIVGFHVPQAYGFVNGADACLTNGPGTLVTGDIAIVNGNTYRVVVGTAGDDTWYGFDDPNTGQRDLMWGLDGNDVMHGGNGDDVLCGDAGADTLFGEAGNDALFGFSGDDVIYGGDGSDLLAGRDGNDTMYGEGGDDHNDITIASGDRAGMTGGSQDDLMYGGDGSDWMVGQTQNDTLYGEKGEDELGGGPDYDVLDGGQNKDKCEGEVEHSCEAPLFPPLN